MTDTMTAPAPEATEPAKKRSARPAYALEPVDVLPDNPKRAGGPGGAPERPDHYGQMIPEVAANPGVWFKLATFYTPTGAQGALKGLAKRIEEGKVDGIPENGGIDLQSRRQDVVGELNPDAPAGSEVVGPILGDEGKVLAEVGTRISKLFAQFVPDQSATA